MRSKMPYVIVCLLSYDIAFAVKNKAPETDTSRTTGVPTLKLQRQASVSILLPESITKTVPRFLIEKAGFRTTDGPAELANNFFRLFSVIGETDLPLASAKAKKRAQYYALLMSAYHLERSIADIDESLQASLWVTHAQIKTQAIMWAGSEKEKHSLHQQALQSIQTAKKSLETVSSERVYNELAGKITKVRSQLIT